MKKLLFSFMVVIAMQTVYADKDNLPAAAQLQNPSSLSVGMDQHGSFTVKDLQSSPLLKSLFSVSVEVVGNHLARVCIEPQHSCKVVRDTDTINIVNSNGVVKFDN